MAAACSDPASESCVSENTLSAFLEGRLNQDSALQLHQHLLRCSSCHALFAAMGAIARSGAVPTHDETAASHVLLSWLGRTYIQADNFEPPAQFDEYQILRLLGKGAMGHVYLAKDTNLDRLVAIKFLTNLQGDHARERLMVEARAIARLHHPNVVAVYRVSDLNGRPFLVSEYVDGQSLDKIKKPIGSKQLLTIGIGLAKALAEAHRQGILHRDVKPANAIITANGVVKLLDFGLAKLQHYSAPSSRIEALAQLEFKKHSNVNQNDNLELTETNTLLGTPRYMAPELWKGKVATTHSDIYSLGMVLYELCSGHALYHNEIKIQDLRRAVLNHSALSLNTVRSSLGKHLYDIIKRCLSHDPDARFSSGEELANELGRLSANLTHSKKGSLQVISIGVLVLLSLMGILYFSQRLHPKSKKHVAMAMCDSDLACPVTDDCDQHDKICATGKKLWRKLPAMSTPRGWTCAAYVNNSIYVFGGVLQSTNTQFSGAIQTVERFDFDSQKWTSIGYMPFPRSSMNCPVLGNDVYLIGGRKPLATATSDDSYPGVHMFNTVTNQWAAAGSLNRARSWASAIQFRGHLYTFGGAGKRTNELPDGYEDSGEIYDPQTKQWRLLPGRLAAGRYMLGVTVHHDKIYAIGGSSFVGTHPDGPERRYNLVELFDVVEQTWRTIGHLPQEVRYSEVFPLDERSLLLVDQNALWRLSVKDWSMSPITDLPEKGENEGRSHDIGLVMTPHGLFAAGGGTWGPTLSANAYLYRSFALHR